MSLDTILSAAADYMLVLSCVLILSGSIWLTFKMRFVQLRVFSSLFGTLKMLFGNTPDSSTQYTIPPTKALFTAMSTTIGIGTIVAPVIAIHLGGPGALLGFLLTAFFGSAATYVEVNLAIQHRKVAEDGRVMGGPMQYLKTLISPAAAKWYALFCFVLMIAWSGAQSNQVAAILDSPQLGDYRIPKMITGAVTAGIVLFLLMGGIKRVGSFSAKLVPVMFVLYLSSAFWIIFSNVDKLSGIFYTMFESALSPYAMATGTVVGGIASALRWGIFKGVHCTEAGVGTQAIPHSMAETHDPAAQATLAMFSTYAAGAIAFISGCVALITGTWEDPTLPLGMSMVAASFEQYFSFVGTAVITICALLFGLGTILGNSFNGQQCFGYLTNNKGARFYFGGTVLAVFFGSMAEVTTLWAMTDIVLACMTLLHMSGLVLSQLKRSEPVQEYCLDTQ